MAGEVRFLLNRELCMAWIKTRYALVIAAACLSSVACSTAKSPSSVAADQSSLANCEKYVQGRPKPKNFSEWQAQEIAIRNDVIFAQGRAACPEGETKAAADCAIGLLQQYRTHLVEHQLEKLSLRDWSMADYSSIEKALHYEVDDTDRKLATAQEMRQHLK